jgi:hypothetical protein
MNWIVVLPRSRSASRVTIEKVKSIKNHYYYRGIGLLGKKTD